MDSRSAARRPSPQQFVKLSFFSPRFFLFVCYLLPLPGTTPWGEFLLGASWVADWVE